MRLLRSVLPVQRCGSRCSASAASTNLNRSLAYYRERLGFEVEFNYGREFYVRDPDGYILGFVQPAEA
jgi:catechol 2,3-dioxygenase-like lactoylglutathione lyase family enzyme